MTKSVRKTAIAALVGCGLALMPTGAISQVADTAGTEEITVEAPRSVAVPVERNPYTGAAVAVTTVKMSLLYGDLDLLTPRDADRLMVRIRSVARDACKQLDRLYPLNPDETCADKAFTNAAPLATAVVAAARAR